MIRFGRLTIVAVATNAFVLAIMASPASAACEFQNVTDRERVVNWVPPHIRGDRDFAGHGPLVSVRATLATGSDAAGRPTVSVHVDMTAAETTRDWTTVAGGTIRLIRVWLTHPGWHVDGVVGMDTQDGTLRYTDTDHSDDLFAPIRPNSFVDRYRVIGDTRGDEAGTRTFVQINIKPITLRLFRCT